MARSNRYSTLHSRFARLPSAAATTAFVLGVFMGALMALSNNGLTPTASLTHDDSPFLSSPPAYPATAGSRKLSPRSPIPEHDAQSDSKSHPDLPEDNAAIVAIRDTEAVALGSDHEAKLHASNPETIELDDSHVDQPSVEAHHHRALRSPAHKRLSRPAAGRSESSHIRGRQVAPRTYNLVQTYQGDTFFTGWDFFNHPDPTNGWVTFQPQDVATNTGLVSVQNGVAIIKVDTTTTLPANTNRSSVRISTQAKWDNGLFVFDLVRAPFGCAVWPAAWLVGPNWPAGGEIDVLEGVNTKQNNQMTLHTQAGCSLDTTQQYTGTLVGSTDCSSNANFNAGCGITDPDQQSYGAALGNAGGGAYATLVDTTGVHIWFWPRASIPSNIGTPDPSTWGLPKAFWSWSSCPQSFFSQLAVTFDITLGGDWAGAEFAQDCPSSGNVRDYILNPANFANADFAINYVKVFQ